MRTAPKSRFGRRNRAANVNISGRLMLAATLLVALLVATVNLWHVVSFGVGTSAFLEDEQQQQHPGSSDLDNNRDRSNKRTYAQPPSSLSPRKRFSENEHSYIKGHAFLSRGFERFPKVALSGASDLDDDDKDRSDKRIYAQPPSSFSSWKRFSDTNSTGRRNLPVKAFLSRGFERIKFTDYRNAVFIDDTSQQVYSSTFKRSLQPWQRPSFTPGMHIYNVKSSFVSHVDRYKESHGGFSFLPEHFNLGSRRGAKDFLEKLTDGGGMDHAWVLKKATTHGSKGVSFLGPQSDDLKQMKQNLDATTKEYKGLVVQKYVDNLLTYHGRKFNIRAFYLVASADPLLVYYFHPPYVHSSVLQYNATDFTGDLRQKHLSNSVWVENATPSQTQEGDLHFKELEQYIMDYVESESPRLGHISDPLSHIKNQMKAAVAEVVAAFRDKSFDMTKIPAENAYNVMGADFFIDQDLRVWMIEINNHAGIGGVSRPQHDVVNMMWPEIVDMIWEVYTKQLGGKEVFPLESAKQFELVYSDDFQYTYDFKRMQ